MSEFRCLGYGHRQIAGPALGGLFFSDETKILWKGIFIGGLLGFVAAKLF